MNTSVVIAVYNGEKYISEQIVSILNQTRKIDQWILVNDFCQDNSLNIAKDLLKNESVEIIHNDGNEGVVVSFEKGLKRANGDIIFFCDQDDIWKEDKVEQFLDLFLHHEVLLVFSDGELIDHNGNQKIDQSFIDRLRISQREKIKIQEGNIDQVLAKKNIISGASMAIHSKVKSLPIFPFIQNEKHMLHDRWISSIVASIHPEKIYFIPDRLYQYRIHESQYIGFNTKEEEEDNVSRTDYFKKEERLLSYILDRVENLHFRRAHYFWYIRSQLHKKPFLQKFISINTLLQEGDYKRNCNRPWIEVLADLKL